MTLSIITINYNNRDGLQRTIDSVICQTWKDYEWIVIDGGSMDGSKELIEQYQEHFAYWCSEPDKGVYNAMNKGVAHAHGEYVIFMNSGDAFYDENILQKVFCESFSEDIIIGQVVSFHNNKLLYQFDGSLLMQLYYTTIPHQASFIRRELLNKHPYDDSLKIVSDWKFWWQTIVYENSTVRFLHFVVALYDLNGISCDESYSVLHSKEREMVLNSFVPPLIQNELQDCRTLQNEPFVKNLCYLRQNNKHIYLFLRKAISLLYKICLRINQK